MTLEKARPHQGLAMLHWQPPAAINTTNCDQLKNNDVALSHRSQKVYSKHYCSAAQQTICCTAKRNHTPM